MNLPRARRLVLLLLLSCASVAGAVALSGCGAADKVASAADPVDEAVAATTKAHGARFQIRMGFEGLGKHQAPAQEECGAEEETPDGPRAHRASPNPRSVPRGLMSP